MSIRTLIVDDEPLARRRLRRLLSEAQDFECAGECGGGRDAIAVIESDPPDLVLLDVEMPDLDGFAVVETLAQRTPPVVFVTAFDHYAVRAFNVHALDYLLKPVTAERFRETLDRARARLSRGGAGDLHRRLEAMLDELRGSGRHLSRIPVRTGGRIVIIDAADIDWVEAADNYVTLHVAGREYLLRETMSRLERSLDPHAFVRIHRSTIVQLSRVKELQPSFHGDLEVVLRDGTRLTMGRAYRTAVERALGRRL